MSGYILDTDILSLFQLNHPVVIQNVWTRAAADVAVTVITIDEQLRGWYTRVRQARKLDELARAYQLLTKNVESLIRFRIVTASEPALLHAGAMKQAKINIGKNDLRIAAIALEHNAIVVTRNRADFQRVPGLVIEDWSV